MIDGIEVIVSDVVPEDEIILLPSALLDPMFWLFNPRRPMESRRQHQERMIRKMAESRRIALVRESEGQAIVDACEDIAAAIRGEAHRD